MKKQLKIHSENIFPIIKKWLYSDKDIFIRELVSNACDAMSKLEMLNKAEELDFDPNSLKIEITIDKEKQTLTFSDGGIGMNTEEVEKYISQIAFSGAEEFLEKYQSKDEKEQIIGHFGLGFYSSYMVAHTVEVHTKSYKKDPSCLWQCDGSSEYSLEEGSREDRGTDIILHITEEEKEFLEDARVKEVLKRYCSFLPYPIYLNGALINAKQPLWTKPVSECTEKEYLDFYHELFPYEPDPLFWVHLNVDYPFHLQGILYFPKLSSNLEMKKNTIKLFCNRVFVSDQCQEILPEYLTILHGAIDSPDIPLNVSRSTLQVDKTVRQLGTHISKKISDKLNALYRDDREKFLSYWDDLEMIVKFGMLHDEKFYERTKGFLSFKNTKNEWTTIDNYLEASKEQKVVTFTPSASHHGIELYEDKGIELLVIEPTMLNQALVSYLEQKEGIKFQRIDSNLHDDLLDPSKEKNLVDADGKSERVKLADLFKAKLGLDHLEVEAKSLASNALPGMILVSEEERRMQEYLAMHQKKPLALGKATFVINTNNKLVNAVSEINETSPELAKQLALDLYDLSRLAQKQLDEKSSASFLKRHLDTLEKLTALKQKA